jgi:hypothetical protein
MVMPKSEVSRTQQTSPSHPLENFPDVRDDEWCEKRALEYAERSAHVSSETKAVLAAYDAISSRPEVEHDRIMAWLAARLAHDKMTQHKSRRQSG